MSESSQSLARHTHITVVGLTTRRPARHPPRAAYLHPHWHVSVRDGILLLAVRLVHAASDEVLWSSDETVR
jgi:hypothetical protein